MAYRTLTAIRRAGFRGFKTIEELRETALRDVPTGQGVYLVVRATSNPPRFLTRSTGGFFKLKNPAVPVSTLKKKWVKDAVILYIGKAGGTGVSAGLQSRLGQYLKFGAGKPIGHWGGRYIWQLADAEKLVVCWKVTPDEEPAQVEKRLITEFCSLFLVKYPFANCRR